MSLSFAAESRRARETQALPSEADNIATLLIQAARMYPRAGVRFSSDSQGHMGELLTYPRLVAQAMRILGGLRRYDDRPGTKVAILLESAKDYIPAFWACVLGGYVPCLLLPIRGDAPRWLKHLGYLRTLLDQPLLVTTGGLRDELPGLEQAIDLDVLRAAEAEESTYEPSGEEPAVLVLTSGSTGNSKAVVLTHDNILASMAGKAERQRLTAADTTLNWISFDHVAALLEAHLLPLYVGAIQVHAEPASILSDPLLFLRIIDRYRVTMTFAPNFLFGQILAAMQPFEVRESSVTSLTLDLSCVRHIISGGEAVVSATGRRFLDVLAPYGLSARALWPAFGMTETCAGSIYSSEFPERASDGEFAALGIPITGMRMRVVDADGRVVADGEPGELQLRGTMVFPRYHNNPEATQAAFTADGWFRTGDLGRIVAGRLHLVGRSKDSIIVSGVNYFSHEIETVLEQVEGIERSFVAAFPTRSRGGDTEQLVLTFATTFRLEDEARLHQLIVAVRNTAILLWGFRPAVILPLPKELFPKSSLGKVLRPLLRKRLEAGDFASYAAYVEVLTSRQLGGYSPPEGAAESAITGIYADLFGLDPQSVSATASFFDLGGTSLDIVRLSTRLERQFDYANLPIGTILQNPTARTLAARLAPESGKLLKYDPIVPLQVTGKGTPLFCVHPGIGEVLVYVNLAKYFVNDRPFFAIRARGLNEGEPYFSTFEEMVDVYAKAIRGRQPHGPYALAGYSYGGPVAFEIAKVLEAQGERVAFVGSIDMPPFIIHHSSDADVVESALILAFFLSLIDKGQLTTLPELLRAGLPQQDPREFLFSIAPPERLKELDLDWPKFASWAALTHSLSALACDYQPSGNVESVTVFHARPVAASRGDWLNEQFQQQFLQFKGWDRFARTPTRYIDVAGEHHTLMNQKYVAGFQAVLRAELDRALAEG